MKAIKLIKENYVKIIAVIFLAVVCSVLTCLLFWPEPVQVMADNSDTYGNIQELVREEVENYISEKKEILTEDDISELRDRVNNILDENGLLLKTIYQSKELEKIIKECVEKTISGEKNIPEVTAEEVATLVKRINENDRAYQELLTRYNSYQTEMSEKLKALREETEKLSAGRSDNEAMTVALKNMEKEIDRVSDLMKELENDTEKRMKDIDTDMLTNRSDFDAFVKSYNDYKRSVNDIMAGKASKNDLEFLKNQAKEMEKNLKVGINSNAKAINSNAEAINAQAEAMSAQAQEINARAQEMGKSLQDSIDANVKAISDKTNELVDALDKSLQDSIKANAEAIKKNAEVISSLSSSLTTSLAGKKLWVGTKAQYDAISSKDPNTLYFVE